MKLLNPNTPLPDDDSESESQPKADRPAGPARGFFHKFRPKPAPVEGEKPPAQAEPQPPAPRPEDRRAKTSLRSSGQGVPPRSRLFNLATNPGARLRAVEHAGKEAKPAKLPIRYRLRPDRKKTRYAFWDVAALLSLVFNAVLLAFLVIMALQIKTMKETISSGLLGGLYTSFVDMDAASIDTTINVDAQIPLNFILPVQTNTTVTLTDKATIPGAHVIITTPLFNINAPANVTLPAGSSLPIALNINIPVQTSIPISLKVPVSIRLAGTGLHGPFIGLQNAIRPYYCALKPDAQYPQGTFICQQASVSTPGAP